MPSFFGKNPTFGDFEGGAGGKISVYGSGEEIKVFFEIAEDEDLSNLTLIYR